MLRARHQWTSGQTVNIKLLRAILPDTHPKFLARKQLTAMLNSLADELRQLI